MATLLSCVLLLHIVCILVCICDESSAAGGKRNAVISQDYYVRKGSLYCFLLKIKTTTGAEVRHNCPARIFREKLLLLL